VSTALTLYDIHDELQAWSNSLELAETDEQRAEIQARVSEYLQLGREKVDRFNEFLSHLESQVALCRSEKERISQHQRCCERILESLECYAVSTIESLGVKKLEGNVSYLRTWKSPDSVEITNASAVPSSFKTALVNIPLEALHDVLATVSGAYMVREEILKDLIKAWLQAGGEIAGARLVTNDENGNGHNHLRRG
jgi:hypothetical protein